MIQKILIYNNMSIRIIKVKNETWFVIKDLRAILDIKWIKTITSKLDNNEYQKLKIKDRRNCPQNTWVISEKGLRKIITISSNPNMALFENWINKEILFCTNTIDKDNQLLKDTIQEIKNLLREITEEHKAKLIFAETLKTSEDCISIASAAIKLAEKNFNIGEKRLFEVLRENDYLGSSGEYYNQPKQIYVDKRFFETEYEIVPLPNDKVKLHIKPVLTMKGFEHIVNEFVTGRLKYEDSKNSNK